MKKEKYDIAMAVGEPLFRHIRETAAPRAACVSAVPVTRDEPATHQ